ncbi:hypothetical protein Syun_021679 [Stephania yunnanensis]|uniref:Uncharacterized protein n=1 Tax=Stephania yunnanensis TaxID=152371 RepID=A0AAP0IGF8_9MAGN
MEVSTPKSTPFVFFVSNPSRRRASSKSCLLVHCCCVSSGIDRSDNAPSCRCSTSFTAPLQLSSLPASLPLTGVLVLAGVVDRATARCLPLQPLYLQVRRFCWSSAACWCNGGSPTLANGATHSRRYHRATAPSRCDLCVSSSARWSPHWLAVAPGVVAYELEPPSAASASLVSRRLRCWSAAAVGRSRLHVVAALDKDDDVTPNDVFLHVHTKDHDGAELVRRHAKECQATLDQSIDENQLYYDAVGDCPKRCVYGLGSHGRRKRRYADPDASTSRVPMVQRSKFDAIVQRLVQFEAFVQSQLGMRMDFEVSTSQAPPATTTTATTTTSGASPASWDRSSSFTGSSNTTMMIRTSRIGWMRSTLVTRMLYHPLKDVVGGARHQRKLAVAFAFRKTLLKQIAIESYDVR